MAVVQSDAGGTSGIDEVESRAGGVFRSEDGGETWVRTSRLNPRPFYFSQIRIDPVNDQRVYRPRLRPLRLRRRREDLPRGPLPEGPPRLPRARRHRNTGTAAPRAAEGGRAARAREEARLAAPPPRDRRRRLPERRRGRDVGPRRPDPVGAVLPDLPRRLLSLPDLRRTAGQRELGRPEPHLHEGRHRQRRLDRGRRRRRLLVRLRSRRPQRRLRRVAGGVRPPLPPRERAGEEPPPRADRGAARLPLPLELAARRQPPREGDDVPRREPRLPRDGEGRAVHVRSAPTSRRRSSRRCAPSGAAPRTTASSTPSPSRRRRPASSGPGPTTASSTSPWTAGRPGPT